ncbi:hypothetical protein LZ578_05185 [Jeotgalibaca sp. MA1X17-3]|uniref:hypothetical protein n=1 Tax=Jeotgalibaca sp. MA1X17-3 TaxID=2908211 RepID=UPI001F27CB55|nr:hypothetical protein [Jeotgalibaca sp. MA1X17-3]UJF16499.1 hypothetical protein LZ578_05185 [Jeotgalibaca sp. MA1X17-3]
MKKFTDLLVYELDRIKYAYLILIGMIVGLQVFAVFQTRNHFMATFNEYQKNSQGNAVDFLNEHGPLQFLEIANNSYYFFSIVLGIIILAIYTVAIWYRDWLGKNSFSYRLLTLPGSRMSVFLSKFITLLFMILGLLAIQLLLIILEEKLLVMITPAQLYQTNGLRQFMLYFQPFYMILPTTLIDFILHYTLGISALATVFMMILIELSFKWKGILLDVGIVAGIILLFRGLYAIGWFEYLYPIETLMFMIAFGVVLFIISVLVSRKLLNEKINV